MKKTRKIFRSQTDSEIDGLCESTKETRQVEQIGNTVFCPLVDGFCKRMDCEQCGHVLKHFPRHVWLCSDCVEDSRFRSHPFWGDIECSLCGLEDGVKVLSTKKDKKPRKL